MNFTMTTLPYKTKVQYTIFSVNAMYNLTKKYSYDPLSKYVIITVFSLATHQITVYKILVKRM